MYEALAATRHTPDWVAGISIGAINAALIAGNPPEQRVERLREFWEARLAVAVRRRSRRADRRQSRPTRDLSTRPTRRSRCCSASPASSRRACRRRRSSRPARSAAISYYDTAPLRATLERLVDFDLHQLAARCAFRSARSTSRPATSSTSTAARQRIDARHVHGERRAAARASRRSRSTASSTGTAAWSRTRRCSTCSTSPAATAALVFQVDLFAARGEMPANARRGRASARRTSATRAGRG